MSEDVNLANATISIRIVHIDHYQQPLQNYSNSLSFQAARLTHHTTPKLPVIRIFGSTPNNQTACIHIHGTRPYLYLPIPHDTPAETLAQANMIRNKIEDALHASYPDDDRLPYIADVTPVSRYDIYGYKPDKSLFLKISTFAPNTISRIASIVSQNGISDLSYPQPYASHIPYVMQFLVDHSLSGMDYIHLSLPKFRPPLPEHHADAEQLFSRDSMKRMFVDGLEKIKPDLFWPFAVPKRSACLLELDAFPEQILNTSPTPPKNLNYQFVSSTLGVLWEEERLRVGEYPLRKEKAVRRVLAGANLTDEFMQERLLEVCKSSSQREREDGKGDHDVEEKETNLEQPEEEEDPMQTYASVLQFLDSTQVATGNEPEEDNIIEEFEDDYAPPPENEEVEDDGVGIARAWADIADCTQQESAEDDERIKAATVRRLDEESSQRIDPGLTQTASVPLYMPIRVNNQEATQPLRRRNRISQGDDADISSFDEEEVPQSWKTDSNCVLSLEKQGVSVDAGLEADKRVSFGIGGQEQLSSDNTNDLDVNLDLGEHLFVTPAEKPPSLASVCEKKAVIDALSVNYKTPFYGKKEDEVKTKEIVGGRIIPVRGSGARGYEPFPTLPDVRLEKASEVKVTVICPVEKPPSLSELRKRGRESCEVGNLQSKKGGIVIDSAGRQVQQRSQGKSVEALTGSAEAAFVHLGETQEVEDIAHLLDEDGYHTPTFDREKQNQSLSPIRDEADLLEHNRPLSPKYDEAFQITMNARHDCKLNLYPCVKSYGTSDVHVYRNHVLLSLTIICIIYPFDVNVTCYGLCDVAAKKSGKRKETPRSATKSSHTRNTTASLTESLHRQQNVTVMSVEILAACYAEKLPDPAQNGILAVSVVAKTEEGSILTNGTTCVIFAVRNPVQLETYYEVITFESELALLDGLARHIRSTDPDVIVGYETQNSSIGYILERSQAISHSFPSNCSRWLKGGSFDPNRATNSNHAAAAYYHRKGADIKIIGRHVLSLWRIVRKEVKLPAYSREAVASDLFGVTFPRHKGEDLEEWYTSQARFGRAIRHLARMAYLDIAIVDKLNILSRTGELARVFGIDFMSVITRGSQYRVESMLRRVSQKCDFLLLAATREEVFRQPAVEALPLVMEPQSALYVDPVIVLDFQSLYPSVIIAHNLCFSTMLGNVNRVSSWDETRRIGARPQYKPPPLDKMDGSPFENIFVASNGEMFVDASVRRGILPILLDEILETRVMVKSAMKTVVGDEPTANMLNARQFGLKMIANVTYGYTSASFSGRMPCAGLADAIVQCGRDSLEAIIAYVEEELRPAVGATVVYGDTDSLFVQVPGATRDEAFDVGERIVAQAAEMFPDPITLKLEKVYQPCILQTKKRYVGYSYESRTQAVPIFDAKGIETVRRDSCPLVQKALERSIRLLFETKDVSIVKRQIQRLCQRLHQDRVPFADYIFRKEVRLGSYKEGHLPPAAIVATKAMERDSRNVPRHGERVPFVVLYERAGAPLKDCVVSPEDFLASARLGASRLNTTYYITKQILPALNRIFSLIGVRVGVWYADMPRPTFTAIPFAKEKGRLRAKQSSLTMFYASERCVICHGKGVGHQMCTQCISDERGMQAARYVIANRLREAEGKMAELWRTCLACVGDRHEIRCGNLICSVHDGRIDMEKQIRNLQHVLNDDDIWKDS